MVCSLSFGVRSGRQWTVDIEVDDEVDIEVDIKVEKEVDASKCPTRMETGELQGRLRLCAVPHPFHRLTNMAQHGLEQGKS